MGEGIYVKKLGKEVPKEYVVELREAIRGGLAAFIMEVVNTAVEREVEEAVERRVGEAVDSVLYELPADFAYDVGLEIDLPEEAVMDWIEQEVREALGKLKPEEIAKVAGDGAYDHVKERLKVLLRVAKAPKAPMGATRGKSPKTQSPARVVAHEAPACPECLRRAYEKWER